MMHRHMKGGILIWKGMTALALCLECWPCGASAFKITTPIEGSVLEPDQEITALVDVGSEVAVGRIRYYWYSIEEEPVVPQLGSPALIATVSSSPPYGGTLKVPAEAIGTMRLLAVGEITRGRLAGREEFDEIMVDIQPVSAIEVIEFEAEKPLRLDTLWKIIDIPSVGLFADGVTRSIHGAASGSTYRSSNEQVITVSPEGTLQVVGNGTAIIIVSNRGQEGALDVVVKTDGEHNRPPIADAGPDQTVKSESKVVLNGLRSTDPDGDPLRYEWKQVRGNKVDLLDADTPKVTFVAPKVSAKRLFRFHLRVTDLKGPDTVKGADSRPSLTNVWVEP